ncbi:MAG: formate dehydrogenase subunit gamma [Magnetospirillum sp.]|nr:formate dehydrogenase subunit gamma [Magnetospirillum sp.]
MTAAWNPERARAIIDTHRGLRGALLPILHALQDEFGYVDPAATPLLAGALNLSQADVHGVIGFYHEFRHSHPGRHVVKVCVAEACQARGAESLVEYLQTKLGIGLGGTTGDGEFTLEAVYCLGNCALGPAAQVDGRLLGRLSPARMDEVLA